MGFCLRRKHHNGNATIGPPKNNEHACANRSCRQGTIKSMAHGLCHHIAKKDHHSLTSTSKANSDHITMHKQTKCAKQNFSHRMGNMAKIFMETRFPCKPYINYLPNSVFAKIALSPYLLNPEPQHPVIRGKQCLQPRSREEQPPAAHWQTGGVKRPGTQNDIAGSSLTPLYQSKWPDTEPTSLH